MNVLLITYLFPPASGVGVFRALSLAKYLPENDIHLEVLTTRNASSVGQDFSALAQVPKQVIVHRTWTLDLPFGLRKAIKRAVTRSPSTAPATAAQTSQASRKPNPIKTLLGNILLPDPQIGWLPFATSASKRLIRSRNIDLVLITVPPFSCVRLVSRLRKEFPDLPIVLDLRDEWITTAIKLVGFSSSKRAHFVANEIESAGVRDATAVVCVTHAAIREVRKRYPDQPAEKFLCVPNGYDRMPDAPSQQIRDAASSRIVITYIGSVYSSTDPTPVIDAILALPSQIREQLHLRFIGRIETPALRASLLRLGDQIELIGFLPQAEAFRYIDSTTYLLVTLLDPVNVAAKLYDYLGAGRPVLAAVNPANDLNQIMKETRAGWSADIYDPTALRQLLIDAVERAPVLAEVFHPNREAVAALHRRPIAARYAAILHALSGEHSVR